MQAPLLWEQHLLTPAEHVGMRVQLQRPYPEVECACHAQQHDLLLARKGAHGLQARLSLHSDIKQAVGIKQLQQIQQYNVMQQETRPLAGASAFAPLRIRVYAP